jgi:hypothetical protein
MPFAIGGGAGHRTPLEAEPPAEVGVADQLVAQAAALAGGGLAEAAEQLRLAQLHDVLAHLVVEHRTPPAHASLRDGRDRRARAGREDGEEATVPRQREPYAVDRDLLDAGPGVARDHPRALHVREHRHARASHLAVLVGLGRRLLLQGDREADVSRIHLVAPRVREEDMRSVGRRRLHLHLAGPRGREAPWAHHVRRGNRRLARPAASGRRYQRQEREGTSARHSFDTDLGAAGVPAR